MIYLAYKNNNPVFLNCCILHRIVKIGTRNRLQIDYAVERKGLSESSFAFCVGS